MLQLNRHTETQKQEQYKIQYTETLLKIHCTTSTMVPYKIQGVY